MKTWMTIEITAAEAKLVADSYSYFINQIEMENVSEDYVFCTALREDSVIETAKVYRDHFIKYPADIGTADLFETYPSTDELLVTSEILYRTTSCLGYKIPETIWSTATPEAIKSIVAMLEALLESVHAAERISHYEGTAIALQFTK